MISPSLTTIIYASTLCALAILEKPAPSQVFASFLAARSHLLEHSSRLPVNSYDTDTIVKRLCSCVYAVTSTFFLIFYMFACPTSQPNPKNPKLLTPTIHKDSTQRQVKHAYLTAYLHATTPPTPPYFYSILQTIRDDIDAIYKVHSLDHAENSDSKAFFSLHIPSSSIHTQCEQWLSHSAQRLQNLACDLLAHVKGAQVLAQVRDGVHSGLNEVIGAPDISWGTVCQQVIGSEVDLWDVLCADTFATRAREIVAHSLQTVDFNGVLSVLLQNPSTGVGVGLWSAESARDEKDTAVIQNKAAGLTPNITEFVQRFDTMLATCLADLAYLTQPPQTTPPSPVPSPHPQPSPRIPQPLIKPMQQGSTQASSTLELYVQDRCFVGVASFLGAVRKRLEVLHALIIATNSAAPHTVASLAYAPPLAEGEVRNWVDEALLIAQAARALSSLSKQLSAALVPTSVSPANLGFTNPATSTPRKTKSLRQAKRSDDTDADSRLATIKTTLRQCYLQGYVLWAKWVTITHTQWLSARIRRDSWNDAMRRQGWEEHKVMIEGDDGSPVEERLYLPYQPSPYVLEFLFAVCREIHRAGGHTIHRTALEYLARDLAQSVLELYDEVASMHHGATSKEGGVQLLCDACFLVDVLSIPDPAMLSDEDLRGILVSLHSDANVVADASSGGTEGRLELAIAWGRRVDKTVSKLKDLLDPIDLAFYEPHIKAFVVRCYQRCSVMFGAFVQLHRSQDSHTKVPPITDPNIVPLAKPTARFGYLPTSVPAPTSAHSANTTPSKVAQHIGTAIDGKEQGGKKLSFMEQGVGSLKKFTSLTFTSPTQPSSSHSPSSGLSTTPPKPGSSLWFF